MFFSKPINVTRSQGGEYDARGHFSPSPRKLLMMYANVQPLQGKELLVLPEGKRTKDSLKIMTDQELLETNEEKNQLPDHILYRGKWYEVHSVKVYDELLPHFETIALNINKPEGAD